MFVINGATNVIKVCQNDVDNMDWIWKFVIFFNDNILM